MKIQRSNLNGVSLIKGLFTQFHCGNMTKQYPIIKKGDGIYCMAKKMYRKVVLVLEKVLLVGPRIVIIN